MAETIINIPEDEAYLQADVLADLYATDAAGNLLSPQDTTLNIHEKAANDAGYAYAVVGVLAEVPRLKTTEKETLQDALLLDVPYPTPPAARPETLPSEKLVDKDLKIALREVDRSIEEDLSLLEMLRGDTTGMVAARREQNAKDTANQLRAAIVGDPRKLAAVLAKRDLLEDNARKVTGMTAEQRNVAAAAASRVYDDQPKPAAVDPRAGKMRFGVPAVSTLSSPGDKGLDGKPLHDGHFRVKVLRPGKTTRAKVYPDDDGLEIMRFQSQDSLARAAHARAVNHIDDTNLDAARQALRLQELANNPAVQEYQAFEEILSHIPEIHGEREARSHVDANFTQPADLDRLLQDNLEPSVYRADPVVEGRVFSTLAKTENYLQALDVVLATMTPYMPEYLSLYALRHDLTRVYVRNLYTYSERRIEKAVNTDPKPTHNGSITGVPDPIYYGNQYAAWHLPVESDGRVPIALENAASTIYADGSFR